MRLHELEQAIQRLRADVDGLVKRHEAEHGELAVLLRRFLGPPWPVSYEEAAPVPHILSPLED